MSFLHLSLLAGGALVVVPLVLHLVMRRRPQHWEFPAVRFLQRRHEQNQRRLQLRHLLLLLLRMAVIALLALALSRPSVKLSGGWGGQEAPVAAALVFDAAPRLQYRHENRTRLEIAQKYGEWLLTQLPRESQIAVLDTHLGPAAFQVDRGAAQQRIARLAPVANSQPLTRVIDDALRLIGGSELARKELYVFTDLAEAARQADAAARLQDRLNEASGVGVYLIDVGVEKPINVGVRELRLSSQVLSQRSSLEVTAEIAQAGAPGERTVELALLDAKRQPQTRAAQTVTLSGGAAQETAFRVGSLELGTHQGFVRVVGQDGLAADDVRFFTVDVRPAWRILAAAPKPAERYALFLAEALAPADLRKQGRARFDCKIVDLEQLAKEDMSGFAAVCLLDPTPLPPSTWQRLSEYVSDGRGLAVFLGRNASPTDSFAAPQAQLLLPGKLVRQARSAVGVHLAPRNLQHPLLKAFDSKASAMPWAQFPVFRYWQLGPPPAGAVAVVPYSDDQPAIVERAVGAGRVIVMTTPISDRPDEKAWNLLPAGEAWPFLILMHQLFGYLAGSADEQLNYYAGQTVVLPLDRRAALDAYLVTTPANLQLPVTVNRQRAALEYAATEEPGNYRVQAGGREAGVDRGFSVNAAPDQCALTRVAPERLKELFGPFDFRLARDTTQLDRAVNTGRVGRELFPFLILVLAAVLAVEQFVANRFYGKEEK